MNKLILEDGAYVTEVPSKKSSPRSSVGTRRPNPLEISAPIPGVVAAVLIKEGDTVEAGRPALYLEAMKMENELSSAVSARVEKICVKVGDRVKKNDILVRLSAREIRK
jgi:biotin carboxyl carrier protein